MKKYLIIHFINWYKFTDKEENYLFKRLKAENFWQYCVFKNTRKVRKLINETSKTKR